MYAATRFGEWARIDAVPKPDVKHVYPLAIWHQARGSAFAARGDLAAAEREHAEVKRLMADPSLARTRVSPVTTADKIVAIAENSCPATSHPAARTIRLR